MLVNGEGAIVMPLPLTSRSAREGRRAALDLRKDVDVPCEVCGADVVVARNTRICLGCGFLGGTDAR
jgi:hypothetical protein